MTKRKTKNHNNILLLMLSVLFIINVGILCFCVISIKVYGEETEAAKEELTNRIEIIEEKLVPEESEVEYVTVWTTANLNSREEATTDSKIIGVYNKGTKIRVTYFNDEWAEVKGTGHYVNRNYLSNTEPKEEKKDKDVESTKKSSFITKEFKLTAYCPCQSCSGGWETQTATGKTATAGRTIAVDPSVIPYGTKVEIDGHTYIAEDCGGGVKGNHIDIFFNSHSEVKAFGKKNTTVKIYY